MRRIGVVTGSRADYGIYLPLLQDIGSDASLELMLFVTGMHLSPEFGSTWKLIEGKGSGGWTPGGEDDSTGQLYNLDQDPSETANVYHAHPEIVQRLGDLLETYRARGRSVSREQN